MPNHCSNDLFITGSKKEIARFKEFAKGNDVLLDVDKFVPYPKKFADMDVQAELKRIEISKMSEEDRRAAVYPEDGYNHGGYEWCVKNWGTKWGMYDVEIMTDTPTRLSYTYNTAWSPAVPVIVKMGELFPTLKFVNKFYEQGMGYKGWVKVHGSDIEDSGNQSYNGPRGG